ncbi:hypothetical protein ACFPJ1_23250 [Kribbella qitaiheensis]|uniref:hypothetical protein n=1 Tax=Kribbella qitaiheensis TaxID=1544730 RepID=UPI003610867E
MGIEEIAAMVKSWMSHSSSPRPDLLLKMAAALSLAASAAPAVTGGEGLAHLDDNGAALSGLWLSRYSYYSSGRAENLYGEHRVHIRRHGDRLIGRGESAPGESRLKFNLSISGAIATGTWTERTATNGYYKGATYHGTLQMIVSPQGRTMNGRWLGFDKEFKVNTGEWSLELLKPSE